MKPVFVNDLIENQTITSFFLVSEKETPRTRKGKSYLRLELADRTGTIEARMWEGFEKDAGAIGRNTVVEVQGRVETYRGRRQLILERIRLAEPGEYDLADFQPLTHLDVDALYARLSELIAGIGNPHLRALLEGLLADPALASRLKQAPAAKSMHHAYPGGLLEHIVNLCELCCAVAPRYPEVNVDLLLAGAILHDIGKLEELRYEGSFGYTTEGLLLGHIVQGLALVRSRIEALEDFPEPLRVAIEHMIVSHHGQYEFGSPRLPMFPEALLLHYLDDLDSKMAAARVSLAAGTDEEGWTARNDALGRRLLDLSRYLSSAADAVAQADETTVAPSQQQAEPRTARSGEA